jgi:hypothetical protein
VSFHPSTTWCSSASDSSGSSDNRASGRASAPASKRSQAAAMRTTVAPSKRSVSYSQLPPTPAFDSTSETVMSNFAGALVTGTASSVRPGSSSVSACALRSANITWKIGA